jgi:glycosyltransferase involved in cell wall biosynthesis
LYSILILQNIAFRSSAGVIFLTKYSSKLVQSSCGHLKNFSIIPHGISSDFKLAQNNKEWPINNEEPIKCIYVSPLFLYKNQWIVVRAIYELRKKGYNVNLTLIGGGSGKAKKIIDSEINIMDPNKLFVSQMDFVSQKEIINQLKSSHIFLFASSCENMPITLLEAMAVGIPIACSSKGPMPEILENGGVYFDPKKHDSISEAVEKIIINNLLRYKNKLNAKQVSDKYSWERCAHETWNYISETYWRINK